MVAKVESQNPKIDSLLWGIAVVLLAGSVGAQYYFEDMAILWRLLGIVFAVSLAMGLVSRTPHTIVSP